MVVLCHEQAYRPYLPNAAKSQGFPMGREESKNDLATALAVRIALTVFWPWIVRTHQTRMTMAGGSVLRRQ